LKSLICDCGQLFAIKLSTFTLLIAEKTMEYFSSYLVAPEESRTGFHSALLELNTLKKRVNKTLLLWDFANKYVSSPKSYPIYFDGSLVNDNPSSHMPVPLKCLKKRVAVCNTGVIPIDIDTLSISSDYTPMVQDFFKTEGGKNPEGVLFLSIFSGSMFFLRERALSCPYKSVSITLSRK